MLPLAGVHVLDLSLLLPGPLAGRVLLDFGARVTKVEPPDPGDYSALWPPFVGDVAAAYWALNRGKEVVTLNLKQPDDHARFLDLVRAADVVLEGFRPGVVDRLGIGFAALRAVNPRVILCSISGYGQTGPLAQRAGHDFNYQALAGVVSLAGGEAQSNPPAQWADTVGGSYAAAMLVLAALLERERTGRGRHLDVSMSEQLLPLLLTAYANAGAAERSPLRDGELLTGGAPSYRAYRTADGHWITLSALEPKFWQAFCAAIERPDLAEHPHLSGPEAESITAEVTAEFARRTRAEWERLLATVDACAEPALTLEEARRHPQWIARGSFERVQAPDGRTMELPKMPGSLAGFTDATKKEDQSADESR